MAGNPEARLRELGLKLPETPDPAGAYVPATRAGNLIFTAGQLPFDGGELNLRGKVGDTVTLTMREMPARPPVCVEAAAMAFMAHSRAASRA